MEDDGGCRRSGSNVTTPPDCAPVEKKKARINDDHGLCGRGRRMSMNYCE